MTDPHAILRAGTAALHDRVERTRLSRRVLAADVTLADYGAFLAATWRVLAPLADALDRAETGDGERAGLGPLVAALEADLARLAVRPGAPLPPALGDLADSAAGRLGALYVAEGSAMGGAVIAKHLRERLGGEAVAASRYLGRAKADAGARWRAWKAAATARDWDEAEMAAALRAADAVFAAFVSAYEGAEGGEVTDTATAKGRAAA